MHFYYSLGTLGKLKRISWTHFEHLEHWSHFKNWAEADTLPLPSSGRYPLLLHLGNNQHISRCLSSSWPCCVRWGGHCGKRCTCQCHSWCGSKREEDKKTLYHQPPFQSLAQLLLAPSWSVSLEKSMGKFMFQYDIQIDPSTKEFCIHSILSSKISLCSELHSVDVKVNGASYEGVSKGGRAVVESFHRHHVPVSWTHLNCAELFIHLS